jgi:hypothetical protein
MPGSYATHPQGSPGSPEAIAHGCTCPVMGNNHGAGIGDGKYLVHQGCPVHADPVTCQPIWEAMPNA